jgi:hypothetical protein
VAADLSACTEQLVGHGVHVRDVLVVSGDRFRSLLCSDRTCCPLEGATFSSMQTSSISAHVVASGRTMPAIDRRGLEADVGIEETRVSDTVSALGDASRARTEDLVKPELIPGLPRPRTQVRHLAAAMGTWATTGELSATTLAGLSVSLGRGTVREHAVRWMVDGVDGLDQRRFWLYVARGVPTPFDAPALALAALGALLEGNGAAANIAFDRASAALLSADEPVDSNVFAPLVDNVGFLVQGGCAPEVARGVLSSAYGWFTPVVVPKPDAVHAARRASGE